MSQKLSDELLSSIIVQGIETLGENPAKLLWAMIEQDYGFTKENMLKDLAAFLEVLQGIFGLGYLFLDSIFKSSLEQATSEKIEATGSFIECVSFLRRNQPSACQIKGDFSTPNY